MTEYSELKRLLTAQVSLHQVARKTETIEDENVYLDADDALNDYLTVMDWDIESVSLALIAENEALRKDSERYQHIKSTWHDGGLIRLLWTNVLPADWDATIDAGISTGVKHA